MKEEKLKEVLKGIELVNNDILTKFPNCSYTVVIRLWDDGTNSIECRHGDGNMIYTSTLYNGELNFDEEELDGRVMIEDKEGNFVYKYLVDSL